MAYTRKLEKELAVAMADRKQAKKLAQELFAAVQATSYADAVGPNFTNDIYIPGLLASDVVLVVLQTPGAAPVTISKWVVAAGKVTVYFSADPSTDHVFVLLCTRN